MSYLILPSRSTRQPPGMARIDWNNPITRGLRAAWMASSANMLVNSVQGSGVGDLTATGSPPIVPTPYGLGYDFNGSSQFLTNTSNSAVTDVPCTFFVFCNPRVVDGRPLTISTGTTADDVIGFQLSSTNINAQHYDGGTNALAYTSISTSIWYSFTGQFLSDSRAIYVNGRLSNRTTGAVAAASGINRVTIGYAPWSSGEYLNGTIALPMMWNRALSDEEILSVSINPWQLFATQRRLWFAPSGGGATTTTINAETGAFALTGAAATLNRGLVPLDAQPTSYTVDGTAATLLRGWNLDAQPGTFAVSGTAATLARGWNLDAQPSTFAVSGTDATLARGWNLDAQPGAFELTGIAATLEYVQPGATTLDGQPGVFAISGAAATLTYVQLTHYVIDAAPGTFTFTGVAGTLTYNQLNAYEITASPGTFAVTGADATLTYNLASIWTDINPASSIWTDIDPNTIWTGL